jgi:hypothetical protein
LLFVLSKRRVEARAEVFSRLDAAIVQYFQQNKSDFKKVNELMIQHSDYKNSKVGKERWENIREQALDKTSKGGLFSKIRKKLF